MGLSMLDLGVLVGYFAIVATIGIIAARLIRTREDYLMGGRRFGKAMMIMFSFGAGTHADSAVGVAAQSYKVGLAGIWYQWITVFTLPIYWLIAPIFRRARVLTTADFFERRFGLPMMYLYSASALFVLVSMNSVMLYGSGKLVEALTNHQVSWQLAVVVMAVVSFCYAIAGGLIAAVWNDFFQGVLTIVMSLLLIPFFWQRIGGLEGFRTAIAASGHPNVNSIFELVLSKDMTAWWIGMTAIASLINMVAQPQILASTAAGRSEMDSRIGFLGGMVLKRLMTIPWALTGVMAVALLGYSKDFDSDGVFGRMSVMLLPAGGVGLMLACVMASVMDNCAVNMLSFAGIYTNSIHTRVIDRGASERKLVWITRLSSIAFGGISLAMSFMFTDVTAAMRFMWQTMPLMGIPWFFAILWPRANRWGAIASYFGALLASACGTFWLGWKGDSGLPATIALYVGCGIGLGVLVSLITPPEPHRRTLHFFMLLKTPIGQEHVLLEAGFRQTAHGTFEAPSEEAGSTKAQSTGWERKLDLRAARRQAVLGAALLIALVAVLLLSVRALAAWFSGNTAHSL